MYETNIWVWHADMQARHRETSPQRQLLTLPTQQLHKVGALRTSAVTVVGTVKCFDGYSNVAICAFWGSVYNSMVCLTRTA